MEVFSLFHLHESTYFLGKSTYFEVFTHLINLIIFENYHLFFTYLSIKYKTPQLNQPMNINGVDYRLASDTKGLHDS